LDARKMNNETKVSKIVLMLMYAWEKRLKTGMYYFRTPAATESAPLLSDAGKSDVVAGVDKRDEVCANGACSA
jgi:hypothetical protein